MTSEIKSIEDEISRAEARLIELDEKRDRVSQRISELKARLSSLEKTEDRSRLAQQTTLLSRPVPSTSAEKVAMFMNLFCGRCDAKKLGLRLRWAGACEAIDRPTGGR